MRALAHPARLVILEYLSLNDEAGATATECAEVVGLSPSATSYHLRALAKAGMIEEAPNRGDGRERVWRRRFRSYEVSSGGENPEEELAMVEAMLAHQNDKIRRYFSVRRPNDAWDKVSTINEYTLVVTPAETAELVKKVDELLRPFERRARTDPPEGAGRLTFQMRAIPIAPL